MPTAYIKEVAEKQNKPVHEVEAKWNEAKQKAAAEGKGDNYAIITEIFKRMTHQH